MDANAFHHRKLRGFGSEAGRGMGPTSGLRPARRGGPLLLVPCHLLLGPRRPITLGIVSLFVGIRLNSVHVSVHSLGVPPKGMSKICFNRAGYDLSALVKHTQ